MSDETKPPSQPVSGYVQEVRPDDPPPSCTVCGKDMVHDGDSYRCQSCGNMTGLSQLASAMSAEKFWPQYLSSVGMAAYDTLNFKKAFAIEFAKAYAARELAIVRAECDSLQLILEQERTQLCDGVNAIKHELDSRDWLTEGRGPYQWNDDRWHAEFGYVGRDIRKALEPLEKIASDLTNCPKTHAEVVEARMNWKQRAEAAEAECDRLKQDSQRLRDERDEAIREQSELHIQTYAEIEVKRGLRSDRGRLRSALKECYIDLAALLNATTSELSPAVREQLQKSHDIAEDALKAGRD